MLLQPNQINVRQFFCQVFQKMQHNQALQPIEKIAAYWIGEHQQYHRLLSNLDLALQQMQQTSPEQENPFLHLSMHLSISEQYSIDQPRGIRQLVDELAELLHSLHLAHHELMPALADMLWHSQQNNTAPDGEIYLEAARRRLAQLRHRTKL